MLGVGDSVQISGCSTKKRILETSSGCDSFDTLIGGALTNSSIVLIDESGSRYYSSFLIRYFLAEGAHHKHNILIADPCVDVREKLLKSIPKRKESKIDKLQDFVPGSSSLANKIGENEMKIAWRYGNVAKVDSNVGSNSKVEEVYDFENFIDDLKCCEIFDPETEGWSLRCLYQKIYDIIHQDEKHVKGNSRGGPKKNFLRIVIQNFDSILWEDLESIPRFLTLLRSLLRSSYAVVYLVTNSYSLEPSLWRSIESLCDINVQLAAFDEEEKKQFRHLGNTHGYFRLKGLPRMSSVGTHTPPILDLIFEAQSRKGFNIRIMHLPPAVDDPSPQNSSCSKLDF